MNFKQWLINEEFVGKGMNGVVFTGDQHKVVKITKNRHEAELARWIKSHPHKNVVTIYSVTKSPEGWKIVMDKVDTKFPDARKLERLRNQAQQAGANTPAKIAAYLEKYSYKEKYVPEVVSAVKHVIKSGMRLTDFLNPNNMGLKNRVIKLFDFQ